MVEAMCFFANTVHGSGPDDKHVLINVGTLEYSVTQMSILMKRKNLKEDHPFPAEKKRERKSHTQKKHSELYLASKRLTLADNFLQQRKTMGQQSQS